MSTSKKVSLSVEFPRFPPKQQAEMKDFGHFTRGIGDVLMATPLIHELRANFPPP